MKENDAVRQRLQKAIGLEKIWEEGAEMRRLDSWGVFSHLAKQSFLSAMAAPFTASMTLIGTVFSLSLFAFFLFSIENLGRIIGAARTDFSMSLYLKDSAEEAQVHNLRKRLLSLELVREVKSVSKDDAIKILRESLGSDSPLLAGLGTDNPLPASLDVTFNDAESLSTQVEDLGESFKADPIVEHVEYSRGFVARFGSFVRILRSAGWLSVTAVLLISGFIIAVAVRLALYSHREEIEIMYLVGASRWFVRAPYMVEGVTQGILGSIISLTLLYLVFGLLREALVGIPAFEFVLGQLEFLSLPSIIIVMLLGAAVGALASFLAVQRFLKAYA